MAAPITWRNIGSTTKTGNTSGLRDAYNMMQNAAKGLENFSKERRLLQVEDEERQHADARNNYIKMFEDYQTVDELTAAREGGVFRDARDSGNFNMEGVQGLYGNRLRQIQQREQSRADYNNLRAQQAEAPILNEANRLLHTEGIPSATEYMQENEDSLRNPGAVYSAINTKQEQAAQAERARVNHENSLITFGNTQEAYAHNKDERISQAERNRVNHENSQTIFRQNQKIYGRAEAKRMRDESAEEVIRQELTTFDELNQSIRGYLETERGVRYNSDGSMDLSDVPPEDHKAVRARAMEAAAEGVDMSSITERLARARKKLTKTGLRASDVDDKIAALEEGLIARTELTEPDHELMQEEIHTADLAVTREQEKLDEQYQRARADAFKVMGIADVYEHSLNLVSDIAKEDFDNTYFYQWFGDSNGEIVGQIQDAVVGYLSGDKTVKNSDVPVPQFVLASALQKTKAERDDKTVLSPLGGFDPVSSFEKHVTEMMQNERILAGIEQSEDIMNDYETRSDELRTKKDGQRAAIRGRWLRSNNRVNPKMLGGN